ncbi:MAG: mechanosensitive ion channel [Bacillota bacterium]
MDYTLYMGIALTAGALGLALAVHVALTRWIAALKRLARDAEEEVFFGVISNLALYRSLAMLTSALRILGWLGALAVATLYLPSLAAARDWLLIILRFLLDGVRSALGRPLIYLGDQPISLIYIFLLILLLFAAFVCAGFSRIFFKRYLLSRTPLGLGTQEALASAASYLVLALATVIALDVVGIDLSTLAVIAGALSIGIGFGLQNIVNNFVSGLIILVERPIKVGDRIEVAGAQGRITRISARSTTVNTNDNVDIIVPNSEFISSQVINWSQADNLIRFRIPVGVAYGSDVDLVMRLLEESALRVSEVLRDPPPTGRFLSFGDNALEMEVRVWTERGLHRRGLVTSNVNREIYKSFIEHGISIPFPQRDIHIQSWPGLREVDAGGDGVPSE